MKSTREDQGESETVALMNSQRKRSRHTVLLIETEKNKNSSKTNM